MTKILLERGYYKIVAGFYEFCFRNRKKKARRHILLNIFPTILVSSDDNYVYRRDDEEWTAIHIQWLNIFVYLEIIKPVRGTAEK